MDVSTKSGPPDQKDAGMETQVAADLNVSPVYGVPERTGTAAMC
jgi:hypothetical protein